MLTYSEIGATSGELPAGYHQVRQSRRIGLGRNAFEAAVEALFHWDMHRRAGLRVAASTPPAREGVAVELRLGGLRLGGLRLAGLTAPCQVVYTVNDEAADDQAAGELMRAGFAYGTLAGHPECGEELFLIELDLRTGEVHASVTAFSRPANWLVRLGRPVNRWVQSAMTRRYLRALEAAAG